MGHCVAISDPREWARSVFMLPASNIEPPPAPREEGFDRPTAHLDACLLWITRRVRGAEKTTCEHTETHENKNEK